MAHFGLNPDMPVVLVVGGSLGARSLNRMMTSNLGTIAGSQIQIVWQTGRWGYAEAAKAADGVANVKVHEFIQRMDLAYAAADVIISRAGAIAISELCIVGKPVVLVPSPNVAEDHQTKNAMALVNKGAALMVPDAECEAKGIATVKELLADKERMAAMSEAIKRLVVRGAAEKIVDEIEKIVK